jgi:hypothetical protein
MSNGSHCFFDFPSLSLDIFFTASQNAPCSDGRDRRYSVDLTGLSNQINVHIALFIIA